MKPSVKYKEFFDSLTPHEVHDIMHWIEAFTDCKVAGDPRVRQIADYGTAEEVNKLTLEITDEFFLILSNISEKFRLYAPTE